MVLGADEAVFYLRDSRIPKDLPRPRYVLRAPQLGFVHSGKLHLWLPHERTVLVMETPGPLANKPDHEVCIKNDPCGV